MYPSAASSIFGKLYPLFFHVPRICVKDKLRANLISLYVFIIQTVINSLYRLRTIKCFEALSLVILQLTQVGSLITPTHSRFVNINVI